MKQIIARTKMVVIVLLITVNAIAQNSTEQQFAKSDTTIYNITFDWDLENEKRERSKMTYQGANICSRWINFSESRFLELKRLDGMKVRIKIRRSIFEGLDSKEARGIDTKYMQGTPNDISCNCILTVEPEE